MTHDLKTLPEYFQPLSDKEKTFEVRLNDRNFKVGDGLKLLEWDSEKQIYTGRVINTYITYILNNQNYCKVGYVIIGFNSISKSWESLENNEWQR